LQQQPPHQPCEGGVGGLLTGRATPVPVARPAERHARPCGLLPILPLLPPPLLLLHQLTKVNILPPAALDALPW